VCRGGGVVSELGLTSLWGKLGDQEGAAVYHPLVFHMLDAGNVARTILCSPLGSHWRERLGRLFGCVAEDVSHFAPFLVALHDVGKAAPDFQKKRAEVWQQITRSGLAELPPLPGNFSHGAEGYAALAGRKRQPGLLARMALLCAPEREGDLFRAIALALGSHHGTFLAASDYQGYPQVPVDAGSADPASELWIALRQRLIEFLRQQFSPGDGPVECQPTNISALTVILNGLTILADWLASDDLCFPHEAALSTDEYLTLSRERANAAVADRGLLDFADLPDGTCFTELFPASAYPGFVPRPLQQEIASLDPHELPDQALVIVEAPTGEGKTEAALQLATMLSRGGASKGLYFALPTVATSNQMYERIHRFLAVHAGSAHPCLLPINGQAEMSPAVDAALARLARSPDTADDGPDVELDTWFLPRKRSLLAPYGVGTVDQAMMAALNLRHVALRLLGLSGKVVIVDEIHAYDAYMSTIIERLLEWLRALGTSVILLSASLPPDRRAQLVRAYQGLSEAQAQPGRMAAAPYPSLTIVDAAADATRVLVVPGAAQPRSVALEPRPGDGAARAANAGFLVSQVEDGGCACWVCNTVREAQAAYDEVKIVTERLPPARRPQVILYHASFLLKHRQAIEERVLGLFGPDPGNRPERAILIATQVIEQSLDLDFDIMMTELAPIDLLIQRMGRLQRHERNRPERFSGRDARLVMLTPAAAAGAVDFGGSAYVYEPFILLKTLIVLAGREGITVPRDVPGLVAAVYDDDPIPTDTDLPDGVTAQQLRATWEVLQARRRCSEDQATIRLLGAPDARGRFSRQRDLSTMDENRGWVAAQTRLARPSVRVVVLEVDDPYLSGNGCLAGAPRRLTRDEIRHLLLHSASSSNRRFVEHILDAGATPSAFARCPALRDYYLVLTEGGSYRWPSHQPRYQMTVSDEVGMRFSHEEVV
jgi:CRISPR-associated endonuclease/helicase Cas3